MARLMPLEFGMYYKIQFSTIIRGHHVYKYRWTPVIGELLAVRKDHSEEAKTYDSHSIGVFKGEMLCGHIPIEL